jgi:formate dehydrogenase alpha subunit
LSEITFTINGNTVKGESGNTILEVARNYGIYIPTLCYDPHLEPYGACRVCLVEDVKRGNLLASCVTPISEGLSVVTDSPKVLEARRVVVKLMLASHPESCIVCEKGNRCQLRQIAAELGIGRVDYYPMPNFTGIQELNPFIQRDLSKCILCAKCIRADHELVVEGAIDYLDRGFDAHPATLADGPLEVSECTFCGTCVEMCPTGALFERGKPARGTASHRVATTCSFCGCGCSLWLEVRENQVIGVRSGIEGSANGMTLCVKGRYGYDFINHPDRLQRPLIRKNGELMECDWDEALAVAAQGLKRVKDSSGGESIALLTGPHCTNEEAVLLKDFADRALGAEVLCTAEFSNLIRGMEETVGYVGTKGSMQDLENADAVLVIGANPTETAPIAGYSIKRGVRKRQSSLIVINPFEIKLTRFARVWLRVNIMTDEMLLLGLLKLLMDKKECQKGISRKDARSLKKHLKQISMKDIEKSTGISVEQLKEALDLFCSGARRAIVFGNGITQQPNGEYLVQLVCILGTIVSRLKGSETVLFPLMYQSNAMGAYHMGLVNGRTPANLFEGVRSGAVKGLWIIGDDPLELPGSDLIEESLKGLEFLIVSDTFLSETAGRADVVFPSASFAEKGGTITNMEGRVQRLRPAIDCVGESRPDWAIVADVAEALGSPYRFESERDITEEMVRRIPLYSKVQVRDMGDEYYSCLLPRSEFGVRSLSIPENVPGIPAMSGEYPYRLVAGSVLFQLGFGHRTAHSSRLARMKEECAEMNISDASQEGVRDGDCIKLRSPHGDKEITVQVTDRVPRGVILIPRPSIKGSNLLSLADGELETIQIRIERASS